MIQAQTILEVADNSGAKRVQCVHVLGGTRRRYARLGDIIVVAVKEALPDGTVKKGTVQRQSSYGSRKKQTSGWNVYPFRPERGCYHK